MHPLIPYHFLRAGWAFTHLSGDQLRAYQQRRAVAAIRYAAVNSPFYRDLWKGYDPADWQHLPIVDKAQMMAHFDTFNTHGITREEAMETALTASVIETLRRHCVGN